MLTSGKSARWAICDNRGGVLIRSIIVVITLMIVGAAIFGSLTTIGKNQQTYQRKALAVSEYGLMKALQKVKSGLIDFADIPKTECDAGWYSVSFKKYEKNDTIFLLIISRGIVGATTETRECTLRLDSFEAAPEWVQYHAR
jgi:hypothetical protein